MSKKTAAKKPARSASRAGTHAAKTPAAKVAKPAKTPAPAPEKKTPAAPKPERQTRSGLAYTLIQEGKTNAEVWAALRAAFDMPENHSYYPSWYRARLVMDGVITKAFAAEHRGPAIARKPTPAK